MKPVSIKNRNPYRPASFFSSVLYRKKIKSTRWLRSENKMKTVYMYRPNGGKWSKLTSYFHFYTIYKLQFYPSTWYIRGRGVKEDTFLWTSCSWYNEIHNVVYYCTHCCAVKLWLEVHLLLYHSVYQINLSLSLHLNHTHLSIYVCLSINSVFCDIYIHTTMWALQDPFLMSSSKSRLLWGMGSYTY